MVKLRIIFIITSFYLLLFFGLSNKILAADDFYGRRSISPDWIRDRVNLPNPTIAPTITPQPTPENSIWSGLRPSRISPTLFRWPGLFPQTSASPTPSPFDVKKDYIMKAINEYRASKGLAAVAPDPYTCAFAKTRVGEITSNFSHDGFTSRVNSGQLPYPSYSILVENLAKTNDYKNVASLWIGSSGHAANLAEDTPFACVDYLGDYYVYEGWKP